jgi:hypothetical protein
MMRKNLTSLISVALLTNIINVTAEAANFTRLGPDNRYVRLAHGDLIIDFDTFYGGAPLSWFWRDNPTSIIHTHAGSGFQITYDTGQDSTQAGPDGVTPFYIAKQGDTSPTAAYDNYYCRESLPANWPINANNYRITCSPPDFWLSHEEIDDAVPPLSNGGPQTGWATHYHPIGHPETDFRNFGTPIWFVLDAQSSGIIMVGNAMLTNPNWNQRLREIPEGRAAFRTQISLKYADASAWAGLLFRRQVPYYAGANMDDAFISPGYYLNVNKSGRIELLRSDGTNFNVVWFSPNAAASTVNSDEGVLLELRTHNVYRSQLEIWVNKAKLAVYNDPNPIYGENFGLIGTGGNGSIKFSNRALFDMSTKLDFNTTALRDGSVRFDATIRQAPGVANIENQFYRFNLVSFLNKPNDPSLVWIGTFDLTGNPQKPLKNYGSYDGNVNQADVFYVGNHDGSRGLQCAHLHSSVNQNTSYGAHVLLSSWAEPTDHSYLHFNALDYSNNSNPVSASEITMSVKCWPTRNRKAVWTTYHGKQLMAYPDGYMIANSPNKLTWETFDIIELGGGKVALRSYHGRLLSAQPDGQLVANRSSIFGWETFDLIPLGGNSYALRSYHGKYVIAFPGGELRADSPNLATWETFQLEYKSSKENSY